MSLFSYLLGINIAFVFVGLFLYLLFGQLTVRKLRKNKEVCNQFGISFVSGWDIYNVAQALSLPRFITSRLENGPLSYLYANGKLLEAHTSKFDKLLANFFYWEFTLSGIGLLILAILHSLNLLS